MNDKYKILTATPQVCKRLFGIDFVLLETVIAKVQNRIDQDLRENPLSKRGIDAEFSVANQILLTFEYLRQYPTFLRLGFSYGISESYCNKIFHKIRPILAEIVGLKNPEKLRYKDVRTVIVDVTVQPIEHPQEEQKLYYNGSKKHIIKPQLIINQANNVVQHCQVELEGRKSDIRIFQETPLEIHPKIKFKGDLGYVGIHKVHARSQIPHKRPRNGALTKAQKRQNKASRSKRVRIEHVNRTCKCFRIIKKTFATT